MTPEQINEARRRCTTAAAAMRAIVEEAEAEPTGWTPTHEARFNQAENDYNAAHDLVSRGEVEESRLADPHMEDRVRPLTGQSRSRSNPQLRQFVQPRSQLTTFEYLPPTGEFRANELFKGGAPAYGQYTYSSAMYGEIVAHLNSQSAIVEAGPTFITTEDNRDILLPVLATDMTANQTAELSPSTQTYPVFDQKTLKAWRQDGNFQISWELLRSADYDLERILGDYAGRALATKVANLLAVGAGTTTPLGLATAASTGVTASSQTAFTVDEILDTYTSLAPPYRKVGSWIFSDAAYKKAIKLKDDDGNYILIPSLEGGAPNMLLGRPVYIEPEMAAVTAGNKVVLFGDVSRFFMRQAGPIVFERDDSKYFDSFIVLFRFAIWIDSVLADASAVKALTMAS